MRSIFYIFFLSQIFNCIGVLADIVNEDQPELNRIKWEKDSKKNFIPLKKIIWKSYNNDENIFENVNVNEASKTKIDPSSKERIYELTKKSASFLNDFTKLAVS